VQNATSVLHTAARFLLAWAPFVKLANDDTIVKETIDAMIDLALNRLRIHSLCLCICRFSCTSQK
jgi:hypothetical protein